MDEYNTHKHSSYTAEAQDGDMCGMHHHSSEIQTQAGLSGAVLEALRKSETRFRELFDSMSSGVAVYETKDHGETFIFRDFNKAGERICNKSKQEVLGKPVSEIFPGVREFGLHDVFTRVWRTGIPEHHPTSMYQDGVLTLWTHNYVYKLSSGEIAAVFEDLSKQKAIEQALQEREALLNEVGSIAKIGGWKMDLITRKAKWTQGTYDIVEIESGQPIPGPDEHVDYYLPEYRPMITETMRALIEEDKPLEFEAYLRTAKGNIKWCRAVGRAVRENGRCIKVYGTFQDITERKQAQETLLKQKSSETERVQTELVKAKEELVRTTRLATIGQVSASIAHDLRNPLASVRNATYLLKRRLSTKDHKITDQLEIIEQEVSRADQIIINLLEMARSRPPTKQVVDLGILLEDVLGKTCDVHNVDVHVLLDPTPFEVLADPDRLIQVFSNILENAVHAMGKEGCCLIEAKHEQAYDTIVIKDNGPGIPEDIRDKLFEPLVTTKAQGTGLGLTICRQIIESHGGSIRAKYPEEGGTLIRIQLPKE